MATRRETSTEYTGVTIRSNGDVRIRVLYQGEWVRERVNVRATPAGFREAARIRQTVNRLSKQGLVEWGEWFPDSSRVASAEPVATFDSVSASWLRRKARMVKPSTHNGYTKWIRVWRRIFGPMPITSIRRSHILDAIDVMGWESGKTMSNAMTPLRAVFDDAIIDDLIDKNPAAVIELPRSQRKPCDPLSVTEMSDVLRHVDTYWLEYFQLAFGTGLRTSELIGLRWPDVNFRRETVRIHSARTDGIDTGETKTRTERTLHLNPMALRALKRQRFRSKGQGHVFLGPHNSEPIQSDQTPRKVWNRAIRAAGIRHRRCYETRHTHATLRLAAGEDLIAVSRDMGHKRPSMTLDHYAGFIKTQDSEEALHAFK